ncbi:MAG TPA: serine/threonine-protein kinase [Kofleriaceae bacterium]|nr:serine/threonine-protein kinase [Kofleriaceae bacterium]
MEGKPKITKEVLCEESRFILANVLAEARYGRQNRYDDIRRVCEGAVSIPFSEYVGFLEAAGYLRHDRESETLEVTEPGEEIVNGGNLTELTQAAVSHFKSARALRRRKEVSGSGPSPMPDSPQSPLPGPLPSGSAPSTPSPARPTPLPPPSSEPRRPSPGGISSGGRPTMAVGGEIRGGPDLAAGSGASAAGGAGDARYERLAAIGSGGIGTVFRARQIQLGRLVALKEIRELFGFFPDDQHGEIVRRFTDVVRQGASLSHPHILPIHEVSLDREHPYVVSELAAFGSARHLLQESETIPVGLALRYLVQTLHALRAAHRERVFHRGLKPENMLIDAYGNLKLSDFGFARIVERDASVIRQVYVGMGAVAYMAPELFADPTSAGPQADIYALGIIFYELLTGRLPGRRSPMPSDIDPKLPRGLDDIFDAMTRDSRSERYPSVDDILEDFEKIDGMSELLAQQAQVLAVDNPLRQVSFRAGSDIAQRLSGSGGPNGSSSSRPDASGEAATADVSVEAGDVLSSAPAFAGDDDDSGRKRRPYSFQQRQRKP